MNGVKNEWRQVRGASDQKKSKKQIMNFCNTTNMPLKFITRGKSIVTWVQQLEYRTITYLRRKEKKEKVLGPLLNSLALLFYRQTHNAHAYSI
jgi:hypothetical protein